MHDSTPALPPPQVARLVESARNGLARVSRNSVPAPVAALELIMASWLAQALCVAAKLGIADALHGGPRTLGGLARELRCNEDALARLLRALEQHGVFRRSKDGRVAQTAISNCLRKDAPLSVRDFALYVGSSAHREHWSELEQSVRSGEPSIEPLRGSSFFEYTRRAPEFGALFDQAMTGLSALAQEALLTRYEFARFRTVVDVGGGHGRLLAAILQRTPATRGVLYDLPEVVADAPALLGRLGVLERCEIVSGSFLDGVPVGGHAYILKHILHDWPDPDALEILRHVRRAIAEDGTLVLFESVVTTDGSPHIAKLTDLEMLLCLGGRERTREEFAALLRAAGFSLTRVVETASPISILEAKCSNDR
jgi:C-methyltransferase